MSPYLTDVDEKLCARPDCGVRFTPSMARQIYCSKKCNDKVYAAKFRERPDYVERRAEHNARYKVKQGDAINERNRRYMQNKRYKRFGATVEDYDRLKEEQQGRCANPGCQAAPELLSFDHCHTALKPRGLLCEPCNKALGFSRDSIEVLEGLITYLRTHGSSAMTADRTH